MVGADTIGRVTRFEEKPRRTQSRLASMGIYVFRRQALVDWVMGAGAADVDFGRHVVPNMLKAGKPLMAYSFDGYWMDAGTVQAYWEANMALLAETPALDMYDPDWVIHTRSEQLAPAFTGAQAQVDGSLLCDGCRVFGRVTRSIIGPGAVVEAGAEVNDSIVMNNTVIGEGARVERSIVDKRVIIGAGSVLGWGDDNTPNRAMPNNLNTGITLGWQRRASSARHQDRSQRGHPAVCHRCRLPAGVRCQRGYALAEGGGWRVESKGTKFGTNSVLLRLSSPPPSTLHCSIATAKLPGIPACSARRAVFRRRCRRLASSGWRPSSQDLPWHCWELPPGDS